MPNFSNIKYEFYGFGGDLIETINQSIYQCGKVVLVGVLQAPLLCVKYSWYIVIVFLNLHALILLSLAATPYHSS